MSVPGTTSSLAVAAAAGTASPTSCATTCLMVAVETKKMPEPIVLQSPEAPTMATELHPHEKPRDDVVPRKPIRRTNSTGSAFTPTPNNAPTPTTTTTTPSSSSITRNKPTSAGLLSRQKSLPTVVLPREESRRCIRQFGGNGAAVPLPVPVPVPAAVKEASVQDEPEPSQGGTAVESLLLELEPSEDQPVQKINTNTKPSMGNEDNQTEELQQEPTGQQEHEQQQDVCRAMLDKLLRAVKLEATSPEQGVKLANLVQTSVEQILKEHQKQSVTISTKASNQQLSSELQLDLELLNLQRKMEELERQKSQLLSSSQNKERHDGNKEKTGERSMGNNDMDQRDQHQQPKKANDTTDIPSQVTIVLGNEDDNNNDQDHGDSKKHTSSCSHKDRRSAIKQARAKSSSALMLSGGGGTPSRAVRALATPRRTTGKPKIQRHNSTPCKMTAGIDTETTGNAKRAKSKAKSHQERRAGTINDTETDDRMVIKALDEGGNAVEVDLEQLNQQLTTFSNVTTNNKPLLETPGRGKLKKSVSARFAGEQLKAPMTAPVKKGLLRKKSTEACHSFNNPLMAPFTPGRKKAKEALTPSNSNPIMNAPMTAPTKRSFLNIKNLGGRGGKQKTKKGTAFLLDSESENDRTDFASPPCSPLPCDSELAGTPSKKKNMLFRGRAALSPCTTPVRRPRGSSLEPRDLRAMSSDITNTPTQEMRQTLIRSSSVVALETTSPQKKTWKELFGAGGSHRGRALHRGHNNTDEHEHEHEHEHDDYDDQGDTDLDIDDSIQDTDVDTDDDDDNHYENDRRRIRTRRREDLKRQCSIRAVEREASTSKRMDRKSPGPSVEHTKSPSRGRGSIERGSNSSRGRGSIERGSNSSRGRGSIERGSNSSRGRGSIERGMKKSSRGRGSIERVTKKSSRGRGSIERKSSSSRVRGSIEEPVKSRQKGSGKSRSSRRSDGGDDAPETPKRDWNRRRRTSLERRQTGLPRDDMLQKNVAQLPDDPHFKVRPELKEKWQRQDRLENIQEKAAKIKQQKMKGKEYLLRDQDGS